MLNRLTTLILLVGMIIPVSAQSVEDLLKQIDLKLRRDKRYLNIHYIDYTPPANVDPALQNIPRTNYRDPFSFQSKDNVGYKIVFLKDAIGIDTLVLLYVDQVTDLTAGGQQGLFGETTGPVIDTQKVLTFEDIYSLIQNQSPAYSFLLNQVQKYIRENPDAEPPTLLRINPDNEVKTSLGVASRDNTDFLNFMRANSIHYYPKPKIEKKGGRRSAPVEVKVPYRIDAGFSSVTFSHEVMEFSFGNAGIEFSADEKTRNLLPYQTQSLGGGVRTLINLSERKEDIDKALVIDARFLGRFEVDLWSAVRSIPFIAIQRPKMHTGNGATVDISLTKPFSMPFSNFAFTFGSSDMAGSPIKRFVRGHASGVEGFHSYYSTTAAEFTWSFYWNTSENFTARFRMDVGAGFFDVYEAYYANNSNSPTMKKEVYAKLSPIVALHFNFSPENTDLFGSSIRVFDSQVKATAWLKLVELEGGHSFRSFLTYLSQPIARKKNNWDTTGGAVFQIRYRYGF